MHVLGHIMSHLNELNLKLQGKNNSVCDFITATSTGRVQGRYSKRECTFPNSAGTDSACVCCHHRRADWKLELEKGFTASVLDCSYSCSSIIYSSSENVQKR